MPPLLDITIALERNQVQSILIEGWPEDMPLPRLAVIDTQQASTPTSSEEDWSSPIGQTVKESLPNSSAYLRSRSIEYVRLAYACTGERWHWRLFVPPKTEGRNAYYIRSDIADEITEFFFRLLQKRHPECRKARGTSGVFHWLIDPEKLVHRHDAQLNVRTQTFVYHDL